MYREREIKVSDGAGSPRRGTPLERVARIFPDCTTTAVVCGYVNRSQSKYICTHRCDAARGARSVDRDAIVCLVPRAVSTFPLPRVMHKVRERVPWQKIDASLRSGDKRDALDPLYSSPFPSSLPSIPFARSCKGTRSKRNKKKKKKRKKREKRKKRKDRRTKEIVANGFSRIIEHTRGDKIRGHGNQDQGDQDNEILVRSR